MPTDQKCQGKTGFPLKVKADVHAIGLMNRPGTDTPFLRSYQCTVCGLYHLTSKPLK